MFHFGPGKGWEMSTRSHVSHVWSRFLVVYFF